MKKSLSVFLAIIITLSLTDNATVSAAAMDSGQSEEDLYRDLVITLIYPHVQQAIGEYYRDYMNYLPGEDPWSFHFLRIEKTPNRIYSYTIVLEVTPYVGPHLSVGKDRITLTVDLYRVLVEKYEHLESYSLPPHYQDILIEPLPG